MRKKRYLTRRQIALRKMAFPAALAILGVAAILLGYGYTPDKARRDSEDCNSLGPTRVVAELTELPLEGAGPVQVVLSENQRGLLLSLAHFHWSTGWQAAGSFVVEDESRGLSGGAVNIKVKTDAMGKYLDNCCLVFGRVTDPAICRVEINMEIIPYEGSRQKVHTVWERQGEEDTFLFLVPWGKDIEFMGSGTLTGYDAQGEEVTQVEAVSWDFVVWKDKKEGTP